MQIGKIFQISDYLTIDKNNRKKLEVLENREKIVIGLASKPIDNLLKLIANRYLTIGNRQSTKEPILLLENSKLVFSDRRQSPTSLKSHRVRAKVIKNMTN